VNQTLLFADTPSLAPEADARFSPCKRYRYWLARPCGASVRTLLWVMLNPSTADAKVDDPTIRRCIGFAELFGFGRLEVVNLYAWRATDPDAMFRSASEGVDIVGPSNDSEIVEAARSASQVIAAWGADARAVARACEVLNLLSRITDVCCLARSKDGSPRHPLYLKADLRPELLRAKEVACG
jgi:hypothetical protein